MPFNEKSGANLLRIFYVSAPASPYGKKKAADADEICSTRSERNRYSSHFGQAVAYMTQKSTS